MVHSKKDISEIKNSIKKLNEHSSTEKSSLTDSIELLWLNAGIQKKRLILSYLRTQTKILQELDNYLRLRGPRT